MHDRRERKRGEREKKNNVYVCVCERERERERERELVDMLMGHSIFLHNSPMLDVIKLFWPNLRTLLRKLHQHLEQLP